MKKTDIVLIVVTIILVIVLAGGFIYDRNSALLDRTSYYKISEDENLEIVKMKKAGMLYMRAAYEAKIKVKNGAADDYVIALSQTYGGAQGQMFDYTQYKQYEADCLNGCTLLPTPRQDSFIWFLGVQLEEKSTKNVVYIISQENDGNTYIYMYYSRK